MPKQVRVDTATGAVSGHRVYPPLPRTDAEWYDEVRLDAPDFSPDMQVVEQDNKLVGNEYVYGFTKRDMTAQELADVLANKWTAVRTTRNRLLKVSDFTQLDDSPKDNVAWKNYRQALRDITTQPDPNNITWPTEPD